MKNAGLLGLLLISLIHSVQADPQMGNVQINFFSEELSIAYPKNMLVPLPAHLKEQDMVAFYQIMERTDYQLLLDALLEKKSAFMLNDWLYYDLMRRTVSAMIGAGKSSNIELTCWFLLTKSGFETRLTYLKDQQFVYVYTEDEVFEVPMITEKGHNFANLTSIPNSRKTNEALYMLNFVPKSAGKPFGFYLTKLPRLKSDIERKRFSFRYKEKDYEMEVDVDKTSAEVMNAYPFIEEQQYLQIPLSPSIAASLMPKFKNWTNGLSKIETLELLVAFTRSSFQYKEDKEFFGRSKPMIADEVFIYPYSDCEDRSALFFCLARELVDLPMIIVAFPDHLTVGVALEEEIGAAIRYEGRNYYICDPTGPVNSTDIGGFPYGYERSKFKIIGQYK
ncbi:hypothetical protein [Flavilitoribacter nigricans]|uniref:Transglutaminase-like domain-containing protein n=1 Tax=Flavilitoribacter nigricans (strain ATCC 23147 / DSM 23189 / NBRC 102662 / NCIMB 1420 / SS-2) TaxID=1122177 RepID=A0A2D0NH20_FLAN2|nr:hypothetical protein [Flavilitoribacter nigricans]PHN07469.1 hypothetical protein CRP01_05035 [Flavilitoribacter nigricans DSM 23189 = NBRC 102662]